MRHLRLRRGIVSRFKWSEEAQQVSRASSEEVDSTVAVTVATARLLAPGTSLARRGHGSPIRSLAAVVAEQGWYEDDEKARRSADSHEANP